MTIIVTVEKTITKTTVNHFRVRVLHLTDIKDLVILASSSTKDSQTKSKKDRQKREVNLICIEPRVCQSRQKRLNMVERMFFIKTISREFRISCFRLKSSILTRSRLNLESIESDTVSMI